MTTSLKAQLAAVRASALIRQALDILNEDIEEDIELAKAWQELRISEALLRPIAGPAIDREEPEDDKTKYLSTFTVEILTDWFPGNFDLDLKLMAYHITDGAAVGKVASLGDVQLVRPAIDEALYAFGSEPGFFQEDNETD